MKEPMNYIYASITCLILGAIFEGNIPLRESYCVYPAIGFTLISSVL